MPLEEKMDLLLVQHGQAKTKAEDPAKPLSAFGVESAEQMAEWLFKAGVGVTQIRHSGKTRAEQTASIFAKHLSPEQGVRAAAGLNPLDDVQSLAEELKGQSGCLMLVGHLPFMSRLAGHLVAGDPERRVVQFQNAGVVCLREAEGQWSVAWAVVPDLVTD